MPAERTRKELFHAPSPSGAGEHHSLQTHGRHNQQPHSQSPVDGLETTSNHWQHSSSSQPTAHSAPSWRYPPLSFDIPRPSVSGVENSTQNYQIALQPAPMSLVSHSTPSHFQQYPPRAGNPASPEARDDMWAVDRPFEARATFANSQWTESTSLSPITIFDDRVSLPPSTPITSSLTFENSSRDEGGSRTGGNFDEAPYLPWLQSGVPHTSDLYCGPHHPSYEAWRRAVQALPSVVTSRLPILPLNKDETQFDPFKFLESINYLDVDRRTKKQSTSQAGKFYTNPGKVKREITDSLAKEFDEHCRSKKPMQPSAKFLIRTEAAVLGRAVFYNRETTLHILTDLDGLIMCPYHTDILKDYKIKGGSGSRTGTRVNPKTQREPGKLHCHCSEDDVILEMMLRKMTVFPAQTEGQMSTMRGDFLNPRARSFVCSLFRNWTGLSAEDMFKLNSNRRVRTYEDILKMQIAGLQNRLAWVTATSQNGRTGGEYF